MQEIKPFVSVIIPTFNRSANLSRCLDSLFNQTYPKDRYEIIIVNDGSRDNTENVLREYKKKAPCEFIGITQENQGIAIATNSGISKSKGDIICFTGDDCIPENNWITLLVNGFTDEKIGAVGGKVVSYQVKTQIQQFVEDCGCLDQEKFVKKNTMITGSAAYRRHILTDIQGLDDHMNACIDLDISIKTQLLGYTLKYVPDAIVYHDHPATVKHFFSQQYRNGIGYVRLHRKYGKKYNLAYNTTIYLYKIFVILICYPYTLTVALILKQKSYFVLKPLFEVIKLSGFSMGVIRETLFGEIFKGEPIQTNVNFFQFMDDKPLFSLWQKFRKKIVK